MERPRIKNDRILLERIEKFISPIYFADVNLHSKLYKHTVKIPSLYHYHAPDRISYTDAVSKTDSYSEVFVGKSFGPSWSTHWFKLDINLSLNRNWIGYEVRLRWNSNSEAMIWRNGTPVQGFTGGDGQERIDYIITENCQGNEKFTLYIEMAANGMFGAGKDGMINTPDPQRTFTLSKVELAVLDREIYKVTQDLKMIIDMAKNLPDESDLRQKALQVGCDVVNCFQPEKINSKEKAMSILDSLFKSSFMKNENPLCYTIHAMGHCHIDTAWLWPYAETKRKCARSWSSTIGLMERFPGFKFVCSQAVQLQWVKENYPELYQKILEYSKRGQFLPTGGSWVEMDGNIPSGESFIRQFFYGQKFFKEEFGSYCKVFWLPDTFGYSAQLPQIAKQCGIKYFLTQKISWSLINKFPHNSFLWQGIDGTRLLTHFPPADTYESSVSFNDVLKTSTQNKDKGIASDGVLLYGFGDGGGGPTEDMIYNLERLGSLAGLPKIEHSTPERFFESLEKVEAKLHTWVGELYLELHQGTFTSLASIKKNNRYLEISLYNTEFLHVCSSLRNFLHEGGSRSEELEICQMEIDDAWKKLLLNQFHDVLPGSSIKLVNDDAAEFYREIGESLEKVNMIHRDILFGCENTRKKKLVINTKGYVRREMVSDDGLLKLVNVPAFCFADLGDFTEEDYKTPNVTKSGDNYILENEHLEATFNGCGQLVSCLLKLANRREAILPNHVGNGFHLYTDIPLFWDAWDVMPYNNETGQSLTECEEIEIFRQDDLRVGIKFTIKISEKSKIHQTVSLDAESNYLRFDTKVDWHENRKMLKVKFPLNVHTDHATYDIQCGFIKRPTHVNTSWDWAKHEVCGHKWADMSEYNYGVALLNDCKYGFSAYGSTLEMSLLRAPKAPDDQADMGTHHFSYALMPHKGSFQDAMVHFEAECFNNPLQIACSDENAVTDEGRNLFNVEGAVVQAIKMHHKIKRGVVIRMYEPFGGHSDVTLSSLYKMQEVRRINALEDDIALDDRDDNICLVKHVTNKATFKIKPFQILTLLVVF